MSESERDWRKRNDQAWIRWAEERTAADLERIEKLIIERDKLRVELKEEREKPSASEDGADFSVTAREWRRAALETKRRLDHSDQERFKLQGELARVREDLEEVARERDEALSAPIRLSEEDYQRLKEAARQPGPDDSPFTLSRRLSAALESNRRLKGERRELRRSHDQLIEELDDARRERNRLRVERNQAREALHRVQEIERNLREAIPKCSGCQRLVFGPGSDSVTLKDGKWYCTWCE